MNDSVYQPTLYVVVAIPYGGIPMDDRDDFDEELTAALNGVLHEMLDGEVPPVQLLDEYGVAEWMREVVKKGLLA